MVWASALVALIFSQNASVAEASTDYQDYIPVQKRLWDEVFNPVTFFEQGPEEPIQIRYSGGDYNWPVWALAGSFRCLNYAAIDYPMRCDESEKGWVLRAVRAPSFNEEARVRYSGLRFLADVETRIRAGAQFADAVSQSQPDWLEARLDECPQVEAPLDALSSGSWTPTQNALVSGEQDRVLVLEADEVDVVLLSYRQRLRFRGWVDEANPAWRARAVFDALSECWRPAQTPPPWRRPEQSAQ